MSSKTLSKLGPSVGKSEVTPKVLNKHLNVIHKIEQETSKQTMKSRRSSLVDPLIFAVEHPSTRSDIIALDKKFDLMIHQGLSISAFEQNPDYDYLSTALSTVDEEDKRSWKKHVLDVIVVSRACEEILHPLVEAIAVSSAEMSVLLRKVLRWLQKAQEDTIRGVRGLNGCLSDSNEKLKHQEAALHELNEQMDGAVEVACLQSSQKIFELENQVAVNSEAFAAADAARERERSLAESTVQALRLENKESHERYAELYQKFFDTQTALDHAAQREDKSNSKLKLAAEQAAMHEETIRQQELVITVLMQREARRDAEIRKLSSLINIDSEFNEAEMQRERDLTNFVRVATAGKVITQSSLPGVNSNTSLSSVLCARCREHLDSLGSIEAALLAPGRDGRVDRLHCERYRLLLDPAHSGSGGAAIGKRRTQNWVRKVMREILAARLNDYDSNGLSKDMCTRFYQFVFARVGLGPRGQGAGMDLYLGVRTLVAEGDSEAALFWTLLSDNFGQEGESYVLYCLRSVISALPKDHPLSTLGGRTSHDSVEVLTVQLQVVDDVTRGLLKGSKATDRLTEVIRTMKALSVTQNVDHAHALPEPSGGRVLCLFKWLRLMLRQLQIDQFQRCAALQLMIETNIAINSAEVKDLSFAQFRSICHSLFPPTSEEYECDIPISEMIELYLDCCFDINSRSHIHLRSRWTAEVVIHAAERRGLLRLPWSGYNGFVRASV